MAACVGIFARLPVVGKVKSRLASSIGAEEATTLYKAFAEHCFSEVVRCPGTGVRLFNSDLAEKEACQRWLEGLNLDIPVSAQIRSPDLGDRMADAMQQMIDSGAKKALIIGTDIPDISADIISSALAALEEYELVLGPACDGGYYLIGATRLPDALLRGIEWSTGSVYEDTARRGAEGGLTVAPLGTLPKLQDIDYVQDLAHWCSGTCPTDFVTPSTHPLRALATAAVAKAEATEAE